MFFKRTFLHTLGIAMALSSVSPAIQAASSQRYDYAIVNEGDKLIGEIQIQLTRIRTCLAEIAPTLKKNGKHSQEALAKIVAYLQEVDTALEGFETRKFTDTDALLWINQLIAFNTAIINHLDEALRSNFKDLDSYDINKLLTQAMGTKAASLDPEMIEIQLKTNDKKLAQLTKKAQGLSWYNHVFRALDDKIITPCQKYSIPQRTLLAAGTVAFFAYWTWQLFPQFFEAQWKKRIGENSYTTFWGPLPASPDGFVVSRRAEETEEAAAARVAKEESNRISQYGFIGKADHIGARWQRNLSPVGVALTGLVFYGWKKEMETLYPKIKKQTNILKNKLKGGVYQQEADRIAQTVDPVRFKDIFGQHEIKRYLQHIVDYLQDPEAADRLGLTPPRGILFIGDTRTGKTHMVNALENEINDMRKRTGQEGETKLYRIDSHDIKKHSINNILAYAKLHAPCVVFIDEIDLLFLQRAGENTILSDFLQAMGEAVNTNDSKKQVIVIAATNRPETLDVALRQPGRFGKELRFEYPNYEDRLQFITRKLQELTLNGVNGLDVEKLARYTEGKSYEALNMLIKNAIIKARLRQIILNQELLDESLDEDIYHIIPTYTKNVPSHEQNILAAHFAGQALALNLTDNGVQLAKVTIKQVMTELKEEFMWTHLATDSDQKKEQQKRFEYGKIFTCHTHDSINMNSKDTKLNLCKMYLAGFIAEELLLGSCSYSCHAESDKQNAMELAKSIAFEGLDAKSLPKQMYAEKYNQALAILEQCKQEVKDLFVQNLEALKNVSAALLERKTLDQDQIKAILNPSALGERQKSPSESSEEAKAATS